MRLELTKEEVQHTLDALEEWQNWGVDVAVPISKFMDMLEAAEKGHQIIVESKTLKANKHESNDWLG